MTIKLPDGLAEIINEMDDEESRHSAGLAKIARRVERHLQDKGFLDAHCEGNFQFNIGFPDSKTVVLKLGRKTYGAHIKDTADVNQAEAIAEMFLERVKDR